MLRGRTYIACRWTLAALVLVTSIRLPAVHHAHAHGEEPHEHSTFAGHTHKHADHDHEHHDGVVEDEHGADQIASSVAHLHIDWLWFSCTLPVHSGPQNTSDESEQHCVLLVQVFDQPVPTSQIDNASWFTNSEVPLVLESAAVLATICRFANLPAIAAPLSDNARHERSGVQLI